MVLKNKKVFSVLRCCGGAFVLNSVDFDFIIDELVDIGDHCGTLYVHQDKGGNNGVVVLQRGVGACYRTGIDIKLLLMLISLETMRVS